MTVLGVTAGSIGYAIQKLSVFEQVIENLKAVNANLIQLSKNCTDMETDDLLSTKDNSKEEFLDILEKSIKILIH